MGADQNLIRAASQMGPKEYDYSGILYLIQAMGKYANTKNAIADELVSYSEQNFNVKEFNEQFFTGAYGEQNMDFLTNKKDEYYKAMQIVKRAPSYTKKYKQAMKTINNIKFIFEKNKADAEQFVAVQQNANNAWLNRSAGMTFEAEDKLADIVTNPYTNKISASLVMSDSGLQVIAPSIMGTLEEDPLNQPIVTGQSPAYNEVMSLADIMMGYKENIVYKKLKLPNDQTQTLVIGDELNKLIEKYGKNAKQNGQPAFEQTQMEQELSALFDQIKKLGPDALRSVAYDYKIGDKTFVQANSYEILDKTDEEWVEMTRRSIKIGDTEFSTTANTEPYVNRKGETVTPEFGADEINQMKKHTLAHAFSTNNYAKLETGIYDYIVNSAKDQYTKTPMKLGKDQESLLLTTGNRILFKNIPIYARTLRGNDKTNPSRTIAIDNIKYRYNDGKWEFNYYGTYEPVNREGKDPGKPGSGRSLFYLLTSDVVAAPELEFLKSSEYNK